MRRFYVFLSENLCNGDRVTNNNAGHVTDYDSNIITVYWSHRFSGLDEVQVVLRRVVDL